MPVLSPPTNPSPFLGSLSFTFFLMCISFLIFAFTFYLEGDTNSKKLLLPPKSSIHKSYNVYQQGLVLCNCSSYTHHGNRHACQGQQPWLQHVYLGLALKCPSISIILTPLQLYLILFSHPNWFQLFIFFFQISSSC